MDKKGIEKHPQRCETCDKQKNETCPAHGATNMLRFEELKTAGSLLDIVGCASHSSAPQPAPAVTNETPKPWVEAYQIGINEGYQKGKAAAEQRIAGVIAELERRLNRNI